MATQTTTANLDKYGDDDLFSTLLRYGLFVGAIFQLLCIGSSILLPASSEGSNSDVEGSEDQKQNNDSVASARRQHKLRKLEKKKRR